MTTELKRDYSKNALLEYLVIFCVFCRLGFPGNLSEMLGGNTVMLAIDYGSSLVQVLIMLMASGDTLNDIRLMNFKKKYYPIYLMLLLLFAMSLLVSHSRIKQLTIIIRFSITALFGLWLADYFSVKRLLEIIYCAQVAIVIANLLTLVVFPSAGYYVDEGYGYIFRGLYTQKNGLGAEMGALLALQTVLGFLRRDGREGLTRTFIVLFVVQVFLLAVSRSTSSLLSTGLTVVYLILVRAKQGRGRRIQWGFVYAVVSVGFLFAASMILPMAAPLLEAMGKDATLSNRTPMWAGIITFMQEGHTLTGYGLLQFWETPYALRILQLSFPSDSWFRSMAYGSHNVILEMWLDVGLIGIAAFLTTLIICFRHVGKLTPERYLLCSALIIPQLIEGLTDRMYTNVNYSTCFFFLLLGTACSWEAEERSPGHEQKEMMANHETVKQ